MKRQASYACWTNREEEILRETYPMHGMAGCAPLLARHTRVAVEARVRVLGLRRAFGRETEKRCTACKHIQPVVMFYVRHGRIHQPCKACHSMQQAARRRAAKLQEYTA